ncbi:FleN family ATPase involved in flagellar biosynthesis [Halanaeroarchaeum sp. HSR-CO]|nr:FleN family ATPase involved in flagellar biosynthesis [Halanaeroarchaeum sp. HSR-CO]
MGKTTTAVNLGAAFAEAGRTVVVVDVDLGMANMGDMLDVETASPTLHDALSGDAAIEETLQAAPGEFDAVLGSRGVEAFGRADPAGLRAVVDDLRERYDVVVLDTGAGLSYDAALPLGLADGVILVTTPDDAALHNAEMTGDIVDRIGGTVTGVVVNRMGGSTGESPSAIASRLGVSVLGSVPEDSAVAESAETGIPLTVADHTSPAAQSFREIAYGILEEPLPRDWMDDEEVGPDSASDDADGDDGDIIVADTGGTEGESDAPATGADATPPAGETETGDRPAAEPDESAVDDVIDPTDEDIIEAATGPTGETEEETAADQAAGDESNAEATTATGVEPDQTVETDDGESGGPGIADAIETAESDPETAEADALVETVDEEGAGPAATDGDETAAESRSLLSKLTGGRFG